jgi:hypothetical protein
VVALFAGRLIGPVLCGANDLRSVPAAEGPLDQPQSARASHRVSPFLDLATHVIENGALEPQGLCCGPFLDECPAFLSEPCVP